MFKQYMESIILESSTSRCELNEWNLDSCQNWNPLVVACAIGQSSDVLYFPSPIQLSSCVLWFRAVCFESIFTKICSSL
jgi:hypothetical protein